MSATGGQIIGDVASHIGQTVEEVSELVIDRTQDLALMLLQQMAMRDPAGARERNVLRLADPTLRVLQRLSVVTPPVAGRVATVSVQVVLRTGVGVARSARRVFAAARR